MNISDRLAKCYTGVLHDAMRVEGLRDFTLPAELRHSFLKDRWPGQRSPSRAGWFREPTPTKRCWLGQDSSHKRRQGRFGRASPTMVLWRTWANSRWKPSRTRACAAADGRPRGLSEVWQVLAKSSPTGLPKAAGRGTTLPVASCAAKFSRSSSNPLSFIQ
jgi:hypothetical protein